MAYEERHLRALEGIKGYLGDLVKVMTAVNENLVEFGKMVKPAEYIIHATGEKIPVEKEDRCNGCGLLYCEVPDCGTKKEGE